MKSLTMICALIVGIFAGGVRAEQGADEQLIALLQGLEQWQGGFVQTQYGPDEEAAVATSKGTFRLLKPRYFSWSIEDPDRQLILADGEFIWHHDLDLETVTRRPLSSQDAVSPLQVLGGDTDILRSDFDISVTGKGRFRLQPTAGNPGFRELTLIFSDSTVSGMEIVDNLGQRLFIELVDGQTAPVLRPADFNFTPPAGADLFFHDQ